MAEQITSFLANLAFLAVGCWVGSRGGILIKSVTTEHGRTDYKFPCEPCYPCCGVLGGVDGGDSHRVCPH